MHLPLFSIIIPTRQRHDTLHYAVTSVLNQSYPLFEIIIQDNCGSPETKETVARFNDNRIGYFRSDKRLSMKNNWECGVSHAKGEYLFVLGDDDALLPDALLRACSLFQIHATLAVSWFRFSYHWPTTIISWEKNRLQVPLRYGETKFNSKEILKAVLAHELLNDYLPMIYNSFIHRSLYDRITSHFNGLYFQGSAPDIASGLINAWFADDYLFTWRPLSLAGVSGHSTGASGTAPHLDSNSRDMYYQELGTNRFPIHTRLAPVPFGDICVASEMLVIKDLLFPGRDDIDINIPNLLQKMVRAIGWDHGQYDLALSGIKLLAEKYRIPLESLGIPPRRKMENPPCAQGIVPTGPDDPRKQIVIVNCEAAGIHNVADAALLAWSIMPNPENISVPHKIGAQETYAAGPSNYRRQHETGKTKLITEKKERSFGNGACTVLLDVSVFGYAVLSGASRTGVARVAENLAVNLLDFPDVSVEFCALESGRAAFGAEQYLGTVAKLQHRHLRHTSDTAAVGGKLIETLDYINAYRRKNQTILAQYEDGSVGGLINSLNQSLKYASIMPPVVDMETLDASHIYHATYYGIPAQIRDAGHVKKVITVYDLIPIICKHLFVGKNDNDYKRMIQSLASIREDDFVICISESSRNDLLNHVKIDPTRVRVIYLAAESNIFKPCPDRRFIAEIRSKYKVPDGPYIIGVCTLTPHKNLSRLVDGYSKVIQEQHIPDLNLVLTGAPAGDELLPRLIEESGLKDRIVITGYVPDADLSPLYSGAMMFVFPSLYEGFGLPILEAMQCGVPVISSNTSSMPEVLGDAGFYFHPSDSEELCSLIYKVYSDSKLRDELAEKGLLRSKQFSWQRCAHETVKVYKALL